MLEMYHMKQHGYRYKDILDEDCSNSQTAAKTEQTPLCHTLMTGMNNRAFEAPTPTSLWPAYKLELWSNS